GFSSIDISYPLLLTELGVAPTCKAYCENPARFLGLNKGVIASGYDADVVIFEHHTGEPERQFHVSGGFTPGLWRIDPGDFHSRGLVPRCVAHGLAYRVSRPFLAGELVYDRSSGFFTRRAIRQIRL